MATRRPLVINDGFPSELPAGDSVKVAPEASQLVAGSGLFGGGDPSTNISLQVVLATAPSGLIYVGDALGLDGSDIVQANTALSSGVAAQELSNTALVSGNSAIFTAESALASGNAALAGIVPLQGGDTYRTIFTSSSNVSVGDAVGVDDAGRVAPIYGLPNPGQRLVNGNVASGYYNSGSKDILAEASGSYAQVIDYNSSTTGYVSSAALINSPTDITLYTPTSIGPNGGSYTRYFVRAGSTNYPDNTFALFAGNTSNGNVYIYRRTGTSTSVGSAQLVQTGWTTSPKLVIWPNNGVILLYGYQTSGGASRAGYIRMGSITTYGLSLGNQYNWVAGALPDIRGCVYDVFASRVLTVDNYTTANGQITWYTHSGTTISYQSGNSNAFNTLPIFDTNTSGVNIIHDPSTNRNIFFYRTNVSSTYYLAYIVIYWTGSTYSFGTPTILSSSTVSSSESATYDTNNNKIIISFYEGSQPKFSIGTISGTTFNVDSTTSSSFIAFDANVSYSPDQDVLLFRNSLQITTAEVSKTVSPTFNTKNNFVGVAQTAAASGSSVTVALPGAISYTTTGLTPGSLYYPDINASGGITTNSEEPAAWDSQTNWRAPMRAVTPSGLMILDSL